MTNDSTTSKIKRYLKTFPLLIIAKRKVWRLLRINRPLPILADKDYFRKLFSPSPNIKSLSFEKGLVLGRFRETSYVLTIRPQNFIESHVYLNKIWEPHLADLITGYLNDPNAAFIDVGANIGATSIPLAKHFKGVRFFLFEPHPLVFQDLENNISFNKLTNIECHNIAVTNQGDTFLPFYAQKNANNFGLSSFTHNHNITDYEVIEVPCTSLDSVLNSDVNVRVIKIDTQGHELNVLLSATQLIKKNRPIVLFEFESEYFPAPEDEKNTKGQILDFFANLKYELYMVGTESQYLPKLTLQDYFHGDILAVPLRY